MKRLILLFLAAVSVLRAMPAPGSTANNIALSLGSTALTSNRFNSLTQQSYTDYEGSILVLCYYTPW
jgi:hypothetical protein